jgi:hypothetical protein
MRPGKRAALASLAALMLMAAADIPVAVTPGSGVAEYHPLAKSTHGIQGALVLVADQRLNPANRKAMQDWYMFGFSDPPPANPPVTAQALADAELRLVDANGATLASQPLATPFAGLQTVALLGSRPTEFVLEIAQGGFGQFTGTLAKPLTVQAGTLRTLSAEGEEIVLVKAPKTDWRIVPGTRGSDIFQVVCSRGDDGGYGYAEDYFTFRQEAGAWRKFVRRARGYCVWPDGFPPFSAFP